MQQLRIPTCGMRQSRAVNKWGRKYAYHCCAKRWAMAPGRKVELGIAEKALGSALLVYMSPLAGLFLCAALFRCCLDLTLPH